MKNSVTFATGKILAILGIASLTVLPVFAEPARWKANVEKSTAWIFLGSNSDLQNVGVARVGGTAEFNSEEPTKSALNVSARLPDGQDLSFKSKRIDLRADGKLQVVGEMTLTRVERDAWYAPGEDYRGPVYGEPRVRAVTREVVFVLPAVESSGEKAEITAEATLALENFPELFAAARQTSWQPLVQNENCEMPKAGEDYRGAICTGRLIEPAYQTAAIRIGEDYRGDEWSAPSGDLMKLILRLDLTREKLG